MFTIVLLKNSVYIITFMFFLTESNERDGCHAENNERKELF